MNRINGLINISYFLFLLTTNTLNLYLKCVFIQYISIYLNLVTKVYIINTYSSLFSCISISYFLSIQCDCFVEIVANIFIKEKCILDSVHSKILLWLLHIFLRKNEQKKTVLKSLIYLIQINIHLCIAKNINNILMNGVIVLWVLIKIIII